MGTVVTIMALIGIGFLAVVLFLARTVVRAEYGWWGPRVAEKIIHLASIIAARPGIRDEWLGELEASQQVQGIPGVIYSLRQLVIASVRMRTQHIRTKQRRAGFFSECYYLYLSVFQILSIVDNAVAGLRSLALHDFTSAGLSFGIVAVIAPLIVWTARTAVRGIDVKWVVSCLETGMTREQLDTCLWTRGERAASAAYAVAHSDHYDNGTPWSWAQRPLSVYRMGWLFNERLFAWSARRAEKRAARNAERA
jgi:hypothetical protein